MDSIEGLAVLRSSGKVCGGDRVTGPELAVRIELSTLHTGVRLGHLLILYLDFQGEECTAYPICRTSTSLSTEQTGTRKYWPSVSSTLLPPSTIN
jgi:hypothetical protein